MDQQTLNKIAVPLATLAALVSLASAIPQAGLLPGILAVIGFAFLVAAIHLARPRPPGPDDEPPHFTGGHAALGAATTLLAATLAAFLSAGFLAQVADVRYLGGVAVFLAENFTVVTGPAAALLALSPFLAATGRMVKRKQAPDWRRYTTLGIHSVILLVALLGTANLVPGLEADQAAYLLALVGLVAWLDAMRLCSLPSPGDMARWLEHGDTSQTRALLRNLAVAGNGGVILLALIGAGLQIIGRPGLAVAAELTALGLLLASTYAASTVRSIIPLELEEDMSTARQQAATLRMLALGPLFVTVVGGLLVLLAMLGHMGGIAALASSVTVARPALGGLIAALAGINLARAKLRAPGKPSEARRATWVVATSLLVAAAFFSGIIHTDIMTGPIVDSGLGLVFDYMALFTAALYVAARGIYPMPWTDLHKEEAPDAPESAEDYRETLERSMLYVYIASGAFLLLVVGGLAAIMFGGYDVALPDSEVGRNAAFLTLVAFGVLLIMGLAALYFQTRRVKAPETEKVDFKKKYTPSEVARLAVLGVSITMAVMLGFLGGLVMAGQLTSFGAIELQAKHSTDFFVFAILIGMGPAGYLYNRERKRIRAIDAQLPEFLRDLAESQRTGMTLTQAVITASKGNYGALTPEVRKMAAQIEWGVSFEDALTSFATRVDTPLVQRTTRLIIEAQNSGGNVIDVLMAASEDAREIQKIDSERKGGMQIYIMIIYIAFLVFLAVIAILNVKFMPEVAKAVAGAEGVSVGSITFAEFDIQAFRTMFFHAAVIQGLGGGFVAGSMEEGKPVAGLKHAFAMVIIAYVAFRFLLGG